LSLEEQLVSDSSSELLSLFEPSDPKRDSCFIRLPAKRKTLKMRLLLEEEVDSSPIISDAEPDEKKLEFI
jgi:hypothetical protein